MSSSHYTYIEEGRKNRSRDIKWEFQSLKTVQKKIHIDNFKKHLADFLGLKEQASKLGLGSFDLKLYRLVKGNGKTENYSILTQQQLDSELPQILAGESNSELNGEYSFHPRLTLN